jgi:predicted  nucleic acid-binding Zn-ribbon protein
MTSETESLILEHLRAIRSKLDEHDLKLKEILGRLVSNEQAIVSLRRDMLVLDERTLVLVHRMDQLDDRLERIEKRLGLIEAS